MTKAIYNRPIFSARSKLAHAVRFGNPERADEARAELAYLKADARVREAASLLPNPTPEQRERLTALLFASGGS